MNNFSTDNSLQDQQDNYAKLTIEGRDNIAKEYFMLARLSSFTSLESNRLEEILELAMLDDTLDSIIQTCDDLCSSIEIEVSRNNDLGLIISSKKPIKKRRSTKCYHLINKTPDLENLESHSGSISPFP
jgi:hypothetical protein